MLRFFRKYQKIILAVGGTILMVIFLVPQAIQGIGQYSAQRGRTQATFVNLSGEKIEVSAGEFNEAQVDLQVITEGIGRNLALAMGLGEVKEPGHWLLLRHEADRLGLVGTPEDGLLVAEDIGRALSSMEEGVAPLPAEAVLQQMASNARVSPYDVQRALMRLRGLQRMIELYVGAANRISVRRMSHKGLEMLPGIDARVVAIPARVDDAGEDEPPAEFSDQELQAQLEAHADVPPGEGERGFGYRLADRVHVEWIQITPEMVRSSIEGSEELTSLELRKYWLRHQDEWPAADFEEVREEVREARLAELTSQKLHEIARYAEGEIARRTRELPRQGVYFVLPEDWESRRIQLVDLAEQIRERFDIVLPAYEKRGDRWFSPDELSVLPGIGRATTGKFGQPVRLSDMAGSLKEFGGSEQIPAQEGVSLPPLTAPDGTVYIARFYEAEASRPPQSIDEVRDQLVTDLRRIQEYERLESMTDEIRQQVLTQGLEAVANEYGALFPQPLRDIGAAPQESLLVQRYGRGRTSLPGGIGRHEPTIEKIVERGRELLERVVEDGTSVDEIPLEDRTFVLEVPGRLAILVVQLTDLRPLVKEDLPLYMPPLGELILRNELGDTPLDIFSYERMKERYQFRMEGVEEEEEEIAPPEEVAA